MIQLTTIVINHNSKEIFNCLESIYSTISVPFETIIVDNNSTDHALAQIKKQFPETKIIENTVNKSYGTACNQAIKIANCKHLLILNPDIILEKNTVTELLKYIDDNKEAKIVSCKLKNSDGSIQDSFREFPTIKNLLKRQLMKTNVQEITTVCDKTK